MVRRHVEEVRGQLGEEVQVGGDVEGGQYELPLRAHGEDVGGP